MRTEIVTLRYVYEAPTTVCPIHSVFASLALIKPEYTVLFFPTFMFDIII